jgi:hypothetical protein
MLQNVVSVGTSDTKLNYFGVQYYKLVLDVGTNHTACSYCVVQTVTGWYRLLLCGTDCYWVVQTCRVQ